MSARRCPAASHDNRVTFRSTDRHTTARSRLASRASGEIELVDGVTVVATDPMCCI